MEIFVEDNGSIDVPQKSIVSDIVQKLDYHLDAVIVVKNGTPLPLDTTLKEGDRLKILSVVSGG